jgi:hypothetical protein
MNNHYQNKNCYEQLRKSVKRKHENTLSNGYKRQRVDYNNYREIEQDNRIRRKHVRFENTNISSDYICAYCSKISNQKLKSCVCSSKVRYCSKRCQKKHWKNHKIYCTEKRTCFYCKKVSRERVHKILGRRFCSVRCASKTLN